MGTEQDRISRRIEKNPVVECNKIRISKEVMSAKSKFKFN
jgi:hypothetical protein